MELSYILFQKVFLIFPEIKLSIPKNLRILRNFCEHLFHRTLSLSDSDNEHVWSQVKFLSRIFMKTVKSNSARTEKLKVLTRHQQLKIIQKL